MSRLSSAPELPNVVKKLSALKQHEPQLDPIVDVQPPRLPLDEKEVKKPKFERTRSPRWKKMQY